MVMKIENYETWKSGIDLDTFTFPHNPSSFDNQVSSNHTITAIPYSEHHIIISGGGHSPITYVLQGFFDGDQKWTNYRNLAKHIHETDKLKKLYFESDKFAVVIGKDIKRTHSGGRTNFIDYVATLESPIEILFGDTLKDNSVEAETNDGDVTTFIEKITGTVTDGNQDIVLSDAIGNRIKIDSSHLTTGHNIVMRLLTFTKGTTNIYKTKYCYVLDTSTGAELTTITTGFGVLKLAAGASTSTISISNLSSPVIYFRDGYSV
ncbi:MAG: hypothetical protein PWQ59_456 [Thermoanaerobacterium sp.]|nr:hypothetical protein [Thermoanaerobacterium sp.]